MRSITGGKAPVVEVDPLLFGCEYMTQGKRTLTVSVRLTEANIIMGQTLAERDNTATNGTLIST